MKENLLRGTHFQERLRSQKQQCSPKQTGAKHLKCGNSTHVAFFQRLGLFPALYVQLSGSKNISKKQRFSQSSFPTPSEVGHLLREIWNRANDSSFFFLILSKEKAQEELLCLISHMTDRWYCILENEAFQVLAAGFLSPSQSDFWKFFLTPEPLC